MIRRSILIAAGVAAALSAAAAAGHVVRFHSSLLVRMRAI